MNNHLLIYKLIFLLACLCYASNSFAGDSGIKFYDQNPTKAQLLEDLKPTSKMATRSYSPRARQATCRDPNFKPKSVAIFVHFGLNACDMTKSARELVDILGEVLTADELRDCDFEIEGHTDISGSKRYNQKLSQKRANMVTKYLVKQHNIEPSRLKAIGYGEMRVLKVIPPRSSKQRRVQIKNVGRFMDRK